MHYMSCADISALYTTKGIKVGAENSHRKQNDKVVGRVLYSRIISLSDKANF